MDLALLSPIFILILYFTFYAVNNPWESIQTFF